MSEEKKNLVNEEDLNKVSGGNVDYNNSYHFVPTPDWTIKDDSTENPQGTNTTTSSPKGKARAL